MKSEGPYVLLGDGSLHNKLILSVSNDNLPSNVGLKKFLDYSRHALLNGKLHLFGGIIDGYRVIFLIKSNKLYLDCTT